MANETEALPEPKTPYRQLQEAYRQLKETQELLLQTEKMASIGQLSAGIAHEINNPISYILSNLATMEGYFGDLERVVGAARAIAARGGTPEALRRAVEDFVRLEREADADFLLKDFHEALKDCREGAARIRDVVRNLKEFSHVDEQEMKRADLNSGLENTIRLCWNELKYNAAVHRDYGALSPVLCYPQRVNQVFMDLLVNAAQALEGKGDIFVTTREKGREATVTIRDTGRGIPPENMPKLFLPFFTTKPVGQGTGLGLHVAYQIVHAHGGKIDVRSEEGKGTEFTVRLPVDGPARGKRP